MVELEDVLDGEYIPQGFRHLFPIDIHKTVMYPELSKGFSRGSFRLGDFIFVMGKDQVLPPTVDVYGVPQICLAHHGTFDMPARPSPPPGAVP